MKTSKKILLTALSATLATTLTSGIAIAAFADTATKDHEYNVKYDTVFEDFDRETITDTVTVGGNGVKTGEKPYLHVNFTAGSSTTADDAIYKQAPKDFQNTNQVENITFKMRSPEEDVELSELKFIVRVDDNLPLEEYTFEQLNDEYLTTELKKPTTQWQDYKISLTDIYQAQKNIVGFHLVAADATAEGTLDIASITYSSKDTYLNNFTGGDSILATAKTTSDSWWADSKGGTIVKRTVNMTGDSFTVVKDKAVGKYSYAVIEAEGDVAKLKVETTDGTEWSTPAAYDGYSVKLTGNEKGFKFIYEGIESVTIKRIYLTNNVIPEPAISVPVIDASTAQVLEDFNVAQKGISGDYNAMIAAPEMEKAGLNYRLTYRHPEMIEVKDGCLVIDATKFVMPDDADDWINFKFHSKSLAQGKYAVLKVKGENGASLDKLSMSLMGSEGDAALSSDINFGAMKAGIDCPVALMTEANPYKDGDWYYIVIDTDESGLGVSDAGYSGLELNYRGTGKLYIDNVFFCDGIDVKVPNVEKDNSFEGGLNFADSVKDTYAGGFSVSNNGYGTTISFDITAKGDGFDVSKLRLQFVNGSGMKTCWGSENAEGTLVTTDGKTLGQLSFNKDVATHVVVDLEKSEIEDFFWLHSHYGEAASNGDGAGAFVLNNVKVHTSTPVYAAKDLDTENAISDNTEKTFTPTKGEYEGAFGYGVAENVYGKLEFTLVPGANFDITELRFTGPAEYWFAQHEDAIITADGKKVTELTFEEGTPINFVLNLPELGIINSFHEVFFHTAGNDTGSFKITAFKATPYVDYITPAIAQYYTPKYTEQLAKLPAALDTVDPTVSISTETTAKVGDEITIAYTASDDMTAAADLKITVSVTKDGNAVALNNNKFTAEEGTYTVTVTARDKNGNEASDTIQITVTANTPVGDEGDGDGDGNGEGNLPPDDITPPPADDDGLSAGAIAGIVIGCIAAVALVGVVVFVVLKKKKNN